MNWTGGGLQRHRKTNASAAVQRQKSHFARVRASKSIPGERGLFLPSQVHANDIEHGLAAPTMQVFDGTGQNLESPVSRAVSCDVEEEAPEFSLRASCSDPIEDQRRALLSRSDWLGLGHSRHNARKRERQQDERINQRQPFQPVPAVALERIEDDDPVSVRIGHEACQRQRQTSSPVENGLGQHAAQQEPATEREKYQNEDDLYALPTPPRARKILVVGSWSPSRDLLPGLHQAGQILMDHEDKPRDYHAKSRDADRVVDDLYGFRDSSSTAFGVRQPTLNNDPMTSPAREVNMAEVPRAQQSYSEHTRGTAAEDPESAWRAFVFGKDDATDSDDDPNDRDHKRNNSRGSSVVANWDGDCISLIDR